MSSRSLRFLVSRPATETTPEVAVSTVTLVEIEYGLRLDPARARKLAPLIRDLVDSMHMLPFTPADASAAAGSIFTLPLAEQELPLAPKLPGSRRRLGFDPQR